MSIQQLVHVFVVALVITTSPVASQSYVANTQPFDCAARPLSNCCIGAGCTGIGQCDVCTFFGNPCNNGGITDKCISCSDGSYEDQVAGTTGSYTYKVCRSCDPCASGEYISDCAGPGTSGRTCSACTTCPTGTTTVGSCDGTSLSDDVECITESPTTAPTSSPTPTPLVIVSCPPIESSQVILPNMPIAACGPEGVGYLMDFFRSRLSCLVCDNPLGPMTNISFYIPWQWVPSDEIAARLANITAAAPLSFNVTDAHGKQAHVQKDCSEQVAVEDPSNGKGKGFVIGNMGSAECAARRLRRNMEQRGNAPRPMRTSGESGLSAPAVAAVAVAVVVMAFFMVRSRD